LMPLDNRSDNLPLNHDEHCKLPPLTLIFIDNDYLQVTLSVDLPLSSQLENYIESTAILHLIVKSYRIVVKS
jgi:hypothetical protein